MKPKFHKCVVNVSPVTNPTPMNKSDKYKVQTQKPRFSLELISVRDQELAPYSAYWLCVKVLWTPGPQPPPFRRSPLAKVWEGKVEGVG